MTYASAQTLLMELPRFSASGVAALNPGLDRMKELLTEMGSPHLSYPTIHVAGTNGKGSTASMISAICTSAGMKAGLHTSPHLMYVGERMRIDGIPATREWLSDAVGRYETSFRVHGVSFFEATTALSMLYFADNSVDVAIIETGLGGRLDATNVIVPMVSVITGVALDHEDILGGSLSSIATEKAGIIKNGVPVVVGPVDDDVAGVFSVIADRVGAPRIAIERNEYVDVSGMIRTEEGSPVCADLPGEHQRTNAVVATRAIEVAFPHQIEDLRRNVVDGLGRVGSYSGLRARLELLNKRPRIIVDVAHNAEAIKCSIRSVAKQHDAPVYLLLALFRDKNIADIARELRLLSVPVITFFMNSPRAYSAEDLARELAGRRVSARFSREPLARYLDTATQDFDEDHTFLVTGSHLLASEALTWKQDRDNQSNIHTAK